MSRIFKKTIRKTGARKKRGTRPKEEKYKPSMAEGDAHKNEKLAYCHTNLGQKKKTHKPSKRDQKREARKSPSTGMRGKKQQKEGVEGGGRKKKRVEKRIA